MDRWNSINPLVENIAGRLARAHLRNAVERYSIVGSDAAMGQVVALGKYVGALYGLSTEDVADLTRRDLAGEDVEPGGKREPTRITVEDVNAVLGAQASLVPSVWGQIADDYHVNDGWLVHNACGRRVVHQVEGPDRLAGVGAVTDAVAQHVCQAKG